MGNIADAFHLPAIMRNRLKKLNRSRKKEKRVLSELLMSALSELLPEEADLSALMCALSKIKLLGLREEGSTKS